MADTLVTLGGFVFLDHEVPASIPFGGKQSHKVHDKIGAARTVDAMGPMAGDKKWSGRFRGLSAIGRAQQIDAMRVAGAAVELTWYGLFFTVLIVEFEANTEKQFEVPYTITCVVIDDPAQDGGTTSSSLDNLVGSDLSAALTTAVGATADVAGALAGIQGAVAALPLLQGSTASQLAPLALATNAAVTTINNDIATNDPALDAASPDGSDPAILASWLSGSASAAVAQSGLADTIGFVTRIGTNLSLGAG